MTGILDCLSLTLALNHSAFAAVAPLDAAVSAPCPLASCVAVAVHARNTVSPMHDAHNSGELVVSSQCRGPQATVWVLVARVPPGRRVPMVGFHTGRRLVSCLRGGGRGQFSAGSVRGQVAGSLPGRQPGTGTRQVKVSAVTPSLHPELPGTNPRHLDVEWIGYQAIDGWTKVYSTAKSVIWVLKGDSRARVLPANLDHLRVEWRKRGRPPGLRQGTTVCIHTRYGHGAAVRP